MKNVLIASLAIAAFGLSGCARHVVLAPDAVHQMNGKDWTVKSEPLKDKK